MSTDIRVMSLTKSSDWLPVLTVVSVMDMEVSLGLGWVGSGMAMPARDRRRGLPRARSDDVGPLQVREGGRRLHGECRLCATAPGRGQGPRLDRVAGGVAERRVVVRQGPILHLAAQQPPEPPGAGSCRDGPAQALRPAAVTAD